MKKSMRMKNWISPEQMAINERLEIIKNQKKKRMFTSFAIAHLNLEVAKISLIDGIKGTEFRNPKMFNKIDKIQTLLEDVQKSEMGSVIRLHPDYADTMENEHALEIYRWFNLMAFYPTESLKEFNDGVELQNKKRNEGVEPERTFTKEDLEYFFKEGQVQEYHQGINNFEQFYNLFIYRKNENTQ